LLFLAGIRDTAHKLSLHRAM